MEKTRTAKVISYFKFISYDPRLHSLLEICVFLVICPTGMTETDLAKQKMVVIQMIHSSKNIYPFPICIISFKNMP